MSGRVLVLARAHSLWQLRAWLFIGVTFAVAMANGGLFMRMESWNPAKIRPLTALYVVLVIGACIIALLAPFLQLKPRLGDVERSLPAAQQDWLRADLLARLRVPVLIFAGALSAHVLVSMMSVLPLATIAVGLSAFGSTVIGIAVGFMLFGKQAKTSGAKLTLAVLPSLALVVALNVCPEVVMAIACTAPLVLAAAWFYAPQSIEELVRSTGGSVAPVAATELTKAPVAMPVGDAARVESPSTIVVMRRTLAFRNWRWWLEIVGAVLVWYVVFLAPPWPVAVGLLVVMILVARPTPVEEIVLGPWRHLPFSRRRLFPVIGWKSVVAPAIGILAAGISVSWVTGENRSVRVTQYSEDIRTTKDVANLPRDVVIPSDLWNVVFESAPIEVRPAHGEPLSITPRMVLPGVYVWHPYQLPKNCSVTTASEQIARALQRVHGTQVEPAEIAGDLVALPGGVGVKAAKGVGWDFSHGKQHRPGIIDRIADAPLLFLPAFGLLCLVVLRKYRVRQLPAALMTPARVLGSIVLVVSVGGALFAVKGMASEQEAIIAIKVVLASIRSSLLVPSWLLFGLCALGVWWLWLACARRFDAMEAPPIHPALRQPE